MKMVEWYVAIEKLLERVDFGAIYPGFHRYPFALYTSQEICLNGEIRPYEAGFIGNTAIPYQGEYTAIWNVEDDSTEDMEAFAASIVHEMFHCHQFASGEKRFPSDLAMLAHPADAAGMNARYGEARYLADAFENGDSSALRRFAALRAARRRNDPGLVEQELKTETIEGAAEFAGMKALRQLNEEKFAAETKRYLQILRAGDETLFDITAGRCFSSRWKSCAVRRSTRWRAIEPHMIRTRLIRTAWRPKRGRMNVLHGNMKRGSGKRRLCWRRSFPARNMSPATRLSAVTIR